MNPSSPDVPGSGKEPRFSALSFAPVFGIGALLLALWWWLPHVLVGDEKLPLAARLTLENALRDSLARVAEATLVFWGASVVWRYLRSLGAVVENSAGTLAAAERTTYFAAQAGETQRYAAAMALLASQQLEVRLGGVYALERLARESERDHGPVMEVLAATLRDRAAWSEGETVAARLPADLQAIATVIGRRHAAFDPSEGHIDLHATALARVYLPGANLAGAFLYEANLQGAILQNADLRGAKLWKADLSDATLEGARLEGADLTGVAGLTPAQIAGAQFDGSTKFPQHLRDATAKAQANGHSGAPAAPSNGNARNDKTPLKNEGPTDENLKLPTMRS